MSDHYLTLGVGYEASLDEIARAYRTLAKLSHPDMVRHLPLAEREASEAKFKTVNDANDTLSNPEKRTVYDLNLEAGPVYETLVRRLLDLFGEAVTQVADSPAMVAFTLDPLATVARSIWDARSSTLGRMMNLQKRREQLANLHSRVRRRDGSPVVRDAFNAKLKQMEVTMVAEIETLGREVEHLDRMHLLLSKHEWVPPRPSLPPRLRASDFGGEV